MKPKLDKVSSTVYFISSSSAGSEFQIQLKYHLRDQGPKDPIPLYRIKDMECFLEKYFGYSHSLTLETLMLTGMSLEFEKCTFATNTGLKHVFSAIVGFYSNNAKNLDKIKDASFGKFANSFLRIDPDPIILGKKKVETCSFCYDLSFKQSENELALAQISNYSQTLETISNIDKKYNNPIYLAKLKVLLGKAGQVLKDLVSFDQTIASKASTENAGLQLVSYNPTTDLVEFTSPLVLQFLQSLCDAEFPSFGMVTLRNLIFSAGQPKNSPVKPLGTHYLSILIKSLKDDVKLLALLSRIGITINYKNTAMKETTASSEYNNFFHSIPPDANIHAAADNGQQDIGSKRHDAHKSHHVDSMNILQTVFPPGNASLSKTTVKTVADLDSSFVLPTPDEAKTKETFDQIFIKYNLELSSLVPSSDIESPKISDIIPIPGKVREFLASEYCLQVHKTQGNQMKASLIKLEARPLAHEAHPDDEVIRWDNKKGNKTCLRHLIIGKSTSEAVFLETLQFLFDTYHNPLREKIFLTLDQALYDVYQKLNSSGRLSKNYVDFFIPVLDAFHLQWTMRKCIFSGFQDAGLREIFSILGIDDDKWLGIKECRDVHKSETLILELLIALQSLFIFIYKGQMSESQKTNFENLSDNEKSTFLASEIGPFLQKVKQIDQSLGIWVDFFDASMLGLMAWESQRIENYPMFAFAVKEFLKFFFCFNNFHYQHSSVEFLRDIALLASHYKNLLDCGIMFSKLSTDSGKSVSVGFILELFNKYIKQATNNLDATGVAWQKTLPKLPFVRSILSSASHLGLFYDPEVSVLSKLPDLNNIILFRWLFEKRNILNLDFSNFEVQKRGAVHLRTEKKLNSNFTSIVQIGLDRLNEFVDQALTKNQMGRLEDLRKELKYSKITPAAKLALPSKKTIEKKKYSKVEKSILIKNLTEDQLPIASLAMVSSNLGKSPRLHGNKSDVPKFLISRYPNCVASMASYDFDVVLVDYMPIAFSEPPSSIYNSKTPLTALSHHIASKFISPNFEIAECLVICVDRRLLQKDFPVKSATQEKRLEKATKCTGVSFLKRLGFILGEENLQVVSDKFVPPFSWILKDRDIRFQLIYSVLGEIISHPQKYFSHIKNFKLIIDGVLDNGKNPHSMIITCKDGLYEFSTSVQTVECPEADQSLFAILKDLDYTSALLKFRDSDIFLSSILAYSQVCSNQQSIHLQFLNKPTEVIDLVTLRLEIGEDNDLSHLCRPIESLILAFISLGNNDYTGKLYGMTRCESVFEALSLMSTDLTCDVNSSDSSNVDNFLPDQYPYLESTGSIFTLSWPGFLEFFKILYILKNRSLFVDQVSLPVPKSVQKWRKPLLEKMLKKHEIVITCPTGKKTVTVPVMKQAIQDFYRNNPGKRQSEMDTEKTEGQLLSEISFTSVAVKIWSSKDKATDWCPTVHQLKNLYSRSILTAMLFFVSKELPSLDALNHFGYIVDLEKRSVSLNLETGTTDQNEKSAAKVLRSMTSMAKTTATEVSRKRVTENGQNKGGKKQCFSS